MADWWQFPVRRNWKNQGWIGKSSRITPVLFLAAGCNALGWGSARPPVDLGYKAGLSEGDATISQWKPNFETAAGKQIRVGNVQLLGFLMKNTGLWGGKRGHGRPGRAQSSSIRNITTTFLQDPKAIRIPPDTGGGMQCL